MDPGQYDVTQGFTKILNATEDNRGRAFLELITNIQKNALNLPLELMEIFSDPNLMPYIGKKDSANIKNEDFVIGLKGKISIREENHDISYRVDYDPDKNLHINFIFSDNNFCIHLPHRSDRFHCSESLSEVGRFIQYKFWTKMTLAYRAKNSPANIDTGNVHDKSSKPDQKIKDFITGQNISLTDIKDTLYYVADYFKNPTAVKALIMDCSSETAVYELMFTNPALRSIAVDSAIQAFFPKYEAQNGRAKSNSKDSEGSASPRKHRLEDSTASSSKSKKTKRTPADSKKSEPSHKKSGLLRARK